MRRFWGKRSRFSPIGIDLGRRGVRVVQLARFPRQTGGGLAGEWQLFKAFCWDWSPGRDSEASGGSEGVSDGRGAPGPPQALRSEDEGREVGARIRRVLRQNEFRGKEVIVGLSSPEVELHALELPVQGDSGTDANLRQAVQWEIERLMSLAQGQVESDFWLLPASGGSRGRRAQPERTGDQHPGQPTAIGVVADKAVVSGVWKMCEAGGVVCRRLDAGACALSRFGAWLRSLPEAAGRRDEDGETDELGAREVWGLLDLGYTQVRLAICVDDLPVLVRCFDTGGNQWINRIADSLGLSTTAAEIHLRDHGIQSPARRGPDDGGRGVRGDDHGAPSDHLGGIIRNILREELESLCGEIERSYRYALQCYPQHRVSELLLVGGAAELRNLDEYLKGRLGIEVASVAKRLEGTVMGAGRDVGLGHVAYGTPFMPSGGKERYSLGALACAIGLAILPESWTNDRS